jgi:tetratricopeptide (TPR) repeat protein
METLLAKNPEDKDILYNLGMVYTEMGQPGKAVELLSKCVRLHPDFANAHVALGVAHARLNEYEKAKENLNRGLDLEPDNPVALRNLGAVLAQEEDYTEALRYLLQSYSISPTDPNGVYGLALVHCRLGQLKEADDLLVELLSLNPPAPFPKLAQELRTEIASETFKSKGLRPDVVLHCLAALKYFKDRPVPEIQKVAFEIGKMGRGGLDVNDSTQKYTLDSMSGKFSALHLLCLMFVGFKIFAPEVDAGFDLTAEYTMAQKLFEQGPFHDPTLN